MAEVKHFHVDTGSQDYIRGQLYAMIFNYLMGQDFTAQALASREAFTVFWKADRINTPAYMFLMNFICWLENDQQFAESEEYKYQNFCNMMNEEMEEGGYFDDDEDDEY